MTTNNHNPQLKQLKRKIQDIDGLTVKKIQSESSYPTDSLAVHRDKHSGVVPIEIQDLVIDREAEIIDVETTTRTLWIIPHRGHGSYYQDLHEEDRPQEVYSLMKEMVETEEEVKKLAEEIKDVADYMEEQEE